MATVAVAVKSADGRGSRRAVRWAIENLMHKADRLVLVRVMPTQCKLPSLSSHPTICIILPFSSRTRSDVDVCMCAQYLML